MGFISSVDTVLAMSFALMIFFAQPEFPAEDQITT